MTALKNCHGFGQRPSDASDIGMYNEKEMKVTHGPIEEEMMQGCKV